MKLVATLFLGLFTMVQSKPAGSAKVPAALNFTMSSIDGKSVDLSRYQGHVVLMVNVASECGFTPQYEGLQELHKRYASKGLSILGFPANDFGAQEPGTNGLPGSPAARRSGPGGKRSSWTPASPLPLRPQSGT